MATKTEIQNVLLSLGFVADRFGHYKKTMRNKLYRVKFQSISVRFEVRDEKTKAWINLQSDYLKNVVIFQHSTLGATLKIGCRNLSIENTSN